jgi:hypothetical protein
MRIAFNEIEMTVLKAARGAGMEWGLAEEAAQSGRWLAGFDLPWAAPLLGLFATGDWRGSIAGDARCLRPAAPDGWLCPIRVGAYLSDLGEEAPPLILRLRHPILLLPFVARRTIAVEVAWEGARFWLDAGGPACHCEPASAIDPVSADWVRVGPIAAAPPGKRLPPTDRPVVDSAAWEALKRLEFRTYVPESLRSRRAGAGPASQDDD